MVTVSLEWNSWQMIMNVWWMCSLSSRFESCPANETSQTIDDSRRRADKTNTFTAEHCKSQEVLINVIRILTGDITGDVRHAPWFCSFRLWHFINHLLTYLLTYLTQAGLAVWFEGLVVCVCLDAAPSPTGYVAFQPISAPGQLGDLGPVFLDSLLVVWLGEKQYCMWP